MRERSSKAPVQARGGMEENAASVPGKRSLTEGMASFSHPGGGAAAPPDVRQRVEAITGADLSSARVHTGGEAVTAARGLSARAFTVNRDIFFNSSQYTPGTPTGDKLIAHELAHVVQQQGGNPVVQTKLETSSTGDASERSADEVANAATRGGRLPRIQLSRVPTQIARDPDRDAASSDAPPSDAPPSDASNAAPQDWGQQYDYDDSATKTGADGWDSRYGTDRTDGNRRDDQYIRQHTGQGGYAKLAPASEIGGTKLFKVTITPQDIQQIFDGIKNKPGIADTEREAMRGRAQGYLSQINAAFETMGIDTVQSQALYLAHTAGETSLGESLVEKHAQKRSYKPFIGRGPLQVTNKAAYVRTIGFLEARSDQLQKSIDTKTAEKAALLQAPGAPQQAPGAPQQAPGAPQGAENQHKVQVLDAELKKLSDQKLQVDECVTAVKADIRAAADPRYAFLFSAAYMHAMTGVTKSASVGANPVFDGQGADESWMTGGNQQNDLDDPGDDPAHPRRRSFSFQQYKEMQQRHGKSTSDMDSAIARGKVKGAVYASAHKVLTAKVNAAKAQAASTTP